MSGKGLEALRTRRAPGRPSRLTTDQLHAIAEIYRTGSRAAGFEADRWTAGRFADAIFVRFGVRYDPDHVGRIMHRLGLRERARHRNTVTGVAYPQFLPEVTSGAA